MPEIRNFTPHPNFRYYSKDNENREFGIIIVKATYELAPSGRLLIAEEQAPMMFTDKCHGDVNVTSLWHPSDLVPNKPGTDIIVNAIACAPDNVPASSWKCGIRVLDGETPLVEKVLRVTGPRQWNPKWKRALSENEAENWKDHRKSFDKWELSDPAPIAELPLHYEYAYGGEIETGLDEDGNPELETSHHNPLGRGMIDKGATDLTKPVAAPQIEADDEPISDPLTRYTPQNLAPIPPAWLPRRPLGGTYDQNWMDNVWPAWPADYDFKFHQSAHPDLILDEHLKGSETINLLGLSVDDNVVSIDLPEDEMEVHFEDEDGQVEIRQMALDTVFLDVAARSKRDWRVYLSWRINFEVDAYAVASIAGKLPEQGEKLVKEMTMEEVDA